MFFFPFAVFRKASLVTYCSEISYGTNHYAQLGNDLFMRLLGSMIYECGQHYGDRKTSSVREKPTTIQRLMWYRRGIASMSWIWTLDIYSIWCGAPGSLRSTRGHDTYTWDLYSSTSSSVRFWGVLENAIVPKSLTHSLTLPGFASPKNMWKGVGSNLQKVLGFHGALTGFSLR